MNQLFKIFVRRKIIFSKNGSSHLAEPSKTLYSRTYHHKVVLPCCTVYMSLTKVQNNHSVDFCRTFTKKKGDDNSNGSETRAANLPKSLHRLARKKKVIESLERRWRLQREMENALQDRLTALTNTRRRIKEKSKLIIQDIKDTKHKMKEKIEEVIEKENVYTIPNLLCVARIGLSPLLGYLIITEKFGYSLAFVFISGVSDWIDGWIARNFRNQSSKIGSFLDPMADKVLIGTLFLSLTYVNLIPVPLTALIIGRDVILIISGFVIRYNSLPPPRTISRYFDVTHATAQLAPTLISKINTGIQLILVGTTLAAPVLGYIDHQFLHVLWYVTATSTIVSASSYIFSKKTYKYFKPNKKSNFEKEIKR